MNQYITGTVIKGLREQRKMTQIQLAEILGVSEKTVSKWETMRGSRISRFWSRYRTHLEYRCRS